MRIQNIDRLLIFPHGTSLRLQDIQATFGIDPDGTNYYYGFNQENVDQTEANKNADKPSALNYSHRAFLDSLLTSTIASADDEKTLVLGVEPPTEEHQQGYGTPYAFVMSHPDVTSLLASDLAGYQKRARAAGKRLNVVIRYASEMNGGSKPHAKDYNGMYDPAGFKKSFVQVRQAFLNNAPDVLFSFSPAMRADIDEASISEFWPGDEYVDVIGGTWYIAKPQQRTASIACMRSYFLHRAGNGKPFAFDEFGGCDANDSHNDAILQDMLHEIESMQMKNISFLYATVFLGEKYGNDATLSFIKDAAA